MNDNFIWRTWALVTEEHKIRYFLILPQIFTFVFCQCLLILLPWLCYENEFCKFDFVSQAKLKKTDITVYNVSFSKWFQSNFWCPLNKFQILFMLLAIFSVWQVIITNFVICNINEAKVTQLHENIMTPHKKFKSRVLLGKADNFSTVS